MSVTLLCTILYVYIWTCLSEINLYIYIGLLHMYNLSVLPPKQHTIPLIASSQISIPNVSPNLTDAHIRQIRLCQKLHPSKL